MENAFTVRRWYEAWRGRTTLISARFRGTGAGGRISKKDIQAAIATGGTRQAPVAGTPAGAAPSAPPRPPATGGATAQGALETAVPRERMYFGQYEVQPMSTMRQNIAEHMVASKRVSPHVYSIDEADMTRIAATRAQSSRVNSKPATAPSLPSCRSSCAPRSRRCAHSPR